MGRLRSRKKERKRLTKIKTKKRQINEETHDAKTLHKDEALGTFERGVFT